ncbi:MAG: hypothetical protein Q4Q08_01695 [Eubacteriales bacterium]|nr:hypothetical protein [Eubacteriales bacterium]
MRTKLAALLLAVLLLTGCVPYMRWQITTNIPQTQQMPAPTPAPTATPQPDSGLSRRQMVYGSAGLLTEPTVLVSVYLNDAAGGRVWTEDAKAETRQYLATAVQWLNEQAETYGRTLQLYYDDGTANSSLCRTYTPKSAIRGGRSSEESDALLTELDAVSATLDTAALQKTYGTDRVAFLYFLPVSGASFTMVHYADDGSNFYHEYSCLYRYDVYAGEGESESPATYAHEILHLFGAPDLYEGSSDDFVDDALITYVEETYPDEIMNSTYNDDGTSSFDSVHKAISPLTAYCLGLTDTCPELELFPKLSNVTPGVFRYPADSGSTPDTGNDADGGGDAGDEPDSAQAWPGAVAV